MLSVLHVTRDQLLWTLRPRVSQLLCPASAVCLGRASATHLQGFPLGLPASTLASASVHSPRGSQSGVFRMKMWSGYPLASKVALRIKTRSLQNGLQVIGDGAPSSLSSPSAPCSPLARSSYSRALLSVARTIQNA